MMEENKDKENVIANISEEKTENTEIPKALKNKDYDKNIKKETGEEFITTEVEKDTNKEEMKDNNKSFKKIYIVFLVVLLLITIIATFVTIRYIDSSLNQNNEVKEKNVVDNVEDTKEIVKKKAEDEKYALKKYSETYDENDLIFKEYIDIDGEVKLIDNYFDNLSDLYRRNYISFIQIDGLTDKQVQNKINNKLKEAAYSFGKNKHVTTNITASFSNVLSANVYCNDENLSHNESNLYFNIDLSTGNEISFEDIFVSSAPIKSILADGMYKTLAWDIKYKNTNEDNWEENFDISKADTSDFEDKSLLLAKRYEKEKGNIKYSLYFDKVFIFGLLDGISEDTNRVIVISLSDYLEDIAIYKRYLTKESLFEKSNIGLKNVIVCEYPYGYNWQNIDGIQSLNLGFISDNVYMEDFMQYYENNEENGAIKKIEAFLQKNSDEKKNDLRNTVNNGLIFQRLMHLSKDRDKPYYYIHIYEVKATCSREYFDNLAFKDYIDLKTAPRADAGLFLFSDNEYEQNLYPNLKITTLREEKEIYFSLDGEFIGNSEEEAIRNLNINSNNEIINENNTNNNNSLKESENTLNNTNNTNNINVNNSTNIEKNTNENNTTNINNTTNNTVSTENVTNINNTNTYNASNNTADSENINSNTDNNNNTNINNNITINTNQSDNNEN